MLISLKGKKTGRFITTPVSYYRDGTILWVLSSRERTWWRNFRDGSSVTLRLCGQNVEAFGEAILDETEVKEKLKDILTQFPFMAHSLGVRMNGTRQPDPDDVARAAREHLFVRIMPKT